MTTGKKLLDFYLLSDVDGTLLPPGGKIPPRNVEALERFTAGGGRFGIASGRSRHWVGELREQLPINAPCVLYNGGMVHDFSTGETIMELHLPDSARDCMEDLTGGMPGMRTVVVTGSDYFDVRNEIAVATHSSTGEVKFHPVRDWRDIHEPWYKVLFLVPAGEYDSFFAYVEGRDYQGVRFVGTNPTLIEMLPEQSSKGYALERLMERKGIARDSLVVVGDFYNDREMIRLAGIGATVADAPEDLRRESDLVVGTCLGGAVADVVEHLERLCI